MSVVVERGLARCPRCVAVADYAFIEAGPNSVWYEVNCRRCGEAYREVHAPVTPDFSGAIAALTVRPLVVRPSTFDRGRRRAGAWLDGVRTKTFDAAAGVSAWSARIVAKVRTRRR